MPVQGLRIRPYIGQAQHILQVRVDPIELRCLKVIGLANDIFEFVTHMTRVQQHDPVRILCEQFIGSIDKGVVRDAARDLLVHDERISRLQGLLNAGQQGVVRGVGALIAKAKINACLLLPLEIRLGKGHGVKVLLLAHQMRGVHAQFVKLASQFSAVEIITGHTDHLNAGRLQGSQVGHDIRRPAQGIIVPGHGLTLQSGLHGDFRALRIKMPVGIHTEVAVHGHCHVLDLLEDLPDATFFHAD